MSLNWNKGKEREGEEEEGEEEDRREQLCSV